MAKHQRQLEKAALKSDLKSGKLADTVVATAVRSGLSEEDVATSYGIEPAEVKQIVRRTPVNKQVIEAAKANLPADLYAIASAATEILLRPDADGRLAKLEELNGVELARMVTYSIHNARLMGNESTQNVFNLSAIVSAVQPTSPNATGTSSGKWSGYGAEGASKPIHPETGAPADPCTVADRSSIVGTNMGGSGKKI